MKMQIFKYPYNLLRDIVKHNPGILEKYGSVEGMENEDVIQKFYDSKKMSKGIYDVLTMRYKDYISVEGICIKTDIPFSEIEQSLSDGLIYLSKMYLSAKSTDYWTVYNRSTSIEDISGLSKVSQTKLKGLGFNELGAIRDCIKKSDIYNILTDTEIELLKGIIQKVPKGNVTFVIIRNGGDVVEGVFVKEGKPLELYTGSIGFVKDIASEIMVCEKVKSSENKSLSQKGRTQQKLEETGLDDYKEVASVKKEISKSGVEVGNSIVRVPKRKVVVNDNGIKKYVEEREEVRKSVKGSTKVPNSIPIIENDKPIITQDEGTDTNKKEDVVYSEDSDGQSYLPIEVCKSFLERTTPIQDCGFKQSVLASLLHHDITTLEEITAYSRSEVKQFSKIGDVALRDIDDKLASVGLCLVDSTDTELESDSDIELDKGTSTVTVSLPKADSRMSDDAKLPEDFLMYIRQHCSEDRAYCTVDSIIGLYVDYLSYNDEENKKVFMSLKSFLGSSINTSIINIVEEVRVTGTFSKSMESVSPFYNKCYKLYQKHWIDKIIALNRTGKKVLDYQYRNLTDALYKNTGKVNFSDVYDLCKIVTTPIIDSDTLYKCYKVLYKNGVHENTYKHILKRYDVKKKVDITGIPVEYNESGSKLTKLLSERNLSSAVGTSVNKFCNYYSCSYELAFSFIDKLLKAVDENTFPVHYDSRNIAVREFIEIFKGDYGCMSMIAEKYPKFFTCSMES